MTTCRSILATPPTQVAIAEAVETAGAAVAAVETEAEGESSDSLFPAARLTDLFHGVRHDRDHVPAVRAFVHQHVAHDETGARQLDRLAHYLRAHDTIA